MEATGVHVTAAAWPFLSGLLKTSHFKCVPRTHTHWSLLLLHGKHCSKDQGTMMHDFRIRLDRQAELSTTDRRTELTVPDRILY